MKSSGSSSSISFSNSVASSKVSGGVTSLSRRVLFPAMHCQWSEPLLAETGGDALRRQFRRTRPAAGCRAAAGCARKSGRGRRARIRAARAGPRGGSTWRMGRALRAASSARPGVAAMPIFAINSWRRSWWMRPCAVCRKAEAGSPFQSRVQMPSPVASMQGEAQAAHWRRAVPAMRSCSEAAVADLAAPGSGRGPGSRSCHRE